jgi:thiamine pyrophosphate-dependent acetolactate synthase large subunit-like protein
VLAALEQLHRAKRPAIIVGHGARQGIHQVLALAERLGAPVLTTFKAKGLLPDEHELAAGVLGRSGTPVASACMNEADLLLVFGASFANHTGISPDKPIVQVDFERMALGKFHPVTVPVWGEIGVTAATLAAGLPSDGEWHDQRPELAERQARWRDEKARRRASAGQGIHPAAIFQALSETCPADAIMTVDVGNNAYAFGRYFEVKRQRVLMSGYLGSIGFALPAALGAWAATTEEGEWQGRRVVSVSGDGGLGQYLAEFTTAVKYGMQLTHVLLNNDALAKISKEQREEQLPVWETSLVNPDFAAYAELCGGLGIRVTRADQLVAALQRALAHDGPSLVEVITDPEAT